MTTDTIALGALPVFVAWPSAPPERAVVVIQEAFGVNGYIERVAQRLADVGYLAVAPHIFHRSGGGTVEYGDMESMMQHVKVLSDDGVLEDLDATLSFLRNEHIGAQSTGVVGFCIGGRMAFLAAARRTLGAAVSFYGGGIVNGRGDAMPPLLPLVSEMRTPWLGLFGEADQGIPSEEVDAVRAALSQATIETAIAVYPGAQHGFHCDARPAAYQPQAAEDGWKRTLDWFGAHLDA